jgi:hypothetical protein
VFERGVPNRLIPIHGGHHGDFRGKDVLRANRAVRDFLIARGIVVPGKTWWESPQPPSTQQEAAKQEAAKQEAAKQEAAKQEAAKQEGAKQQGAKQGGAKLETRRPEASPGAGPVSKVER